MASKDSPLDVADGSSHEPSEPPTRDERVVEVLLTVLMPLLITVVAFGVILLAFSQWKLY